MTRIAVKNVFGSYGKKQVLKGVDLSAAAGQCVGIVGENGCGKSTLFNILAGLKKADSGEVCFDTGKPPAECTGYVPQEGFLIVDQGCGQLAEIEQNYTKCAESRAFVLFRIKEADEKDG